MAKNPGGFSYASGKPFTRKISDFAVKSIDKCDKVRRTVIIQLFSAIILDTPVLEGRLRGNWQTKAKNPITGTTDRVDKTGTATTNEVVNQVISAGSEDSIYMTNNLPYARRIEYDGYSSKSLQGMMRRNVARFERLVRQEAKKVRNQK